MLYVNSPEYELRLRKPFSPTKVTLKEIHDAVPKHLLRQDSIKGTYYVLRDVVFTAALYRLAGCITPWAESGFWGYVLTQWKKDALTCLLWLTYWWTQGLVAAGLFCLGHDAGHGSLYRSSKINNAVGFLLHSYLLAPYFSWRATHHAHHRGAGSMERDENYIPRTRSEFNLPEEEAATRKDYSDAFEEAPIFTLGRMVAMQALGLWFYLAFNTLGLPSYPPGTSHYNPKSALFKDSQRKYVLLSDVGIMTMIMILFYQGREFFFWYYLIPYMLANHWIVMFTFLQHSDPTIPHYRKGAWSFLRGAISTVDRPLMGWIGRFFFHNICHDHTAHHLFISAPFSETLKPLNNGPKITEAIKTVLKDDYNHDSTPSFLALYRTFTQCLFVEDEGDILFYKNKDGVAGRQLAPEPKESPIQLEKEGCTTNVA